MSKYTTELRYICENAAGYTESKGLTDVDTIIAAARPNIFNFDYPIFDANYKSVLETKILNHYYFREIGMETVGLWRFSLKRKMNEIMPYYNQLYSSELIQFNPMYNVKYDISHSGSNTGNNRENEDVTIDRSGTDANAYTGSTLVKESDTPQGTVANLDNNTYLTRATKTDDTSGNTRNYTDGENTERNKTGNFTNTDQYLRHVEGNMGGKGFSEMLQDYRKTFLNIDMMVIDELNDLFMLIW